MKFESRLRALVHPLVEEQILARQPRLWVLALCFAAPTWFLTWVAALLMRWHGFSSWSAKHPDGYQEIFFVVQSGILIWVVCFLSARYRAAIWAPQPRSWRRAGLASLLLLPLLFFQFEKLILGSLTVAALRLLPMPERDVALVYHQVWGVLAYGGSFVGMMINSILVLTGPILDEIAFSGFLANAVLRKFGVIGTVVVVPLVFALCHAVQFGFGMLLVPLFFAGMTYTSMRLFGGSLWLSLAAHCLINFVVMVPKWELAYFFFKGN